MMNFALTMMIFAAQSPRDAFHGENVFALMNDEFALKMMDFVLKNDELWQLMATFSYRRASFPARAITPRCRS